MEATATQRYPSDFKIKDGAQPRRLRPGSRLETQLFPPAKNDVSYGERLLVKKVIENKGNISKSVKELSKEYIKENPQSWINKSHVRTYVGEQVLDRPAVRNYLQKILESAGLSQETMAKKLKVIVGAGTGKRALREAKVKDALVALRMGFELSDSFPSTKIETKSTNLDIQLKATNPDELNDLLMKLQQDTKNFLETSKS